MKSGLKTKIVAGVVVAVLLVSVFVAFLSSATVFNSEVSSALGTFTTVGPILSGDRVTQTFRSSLPKVSYMSLLMATYGRSDTTVLTVGIDRLENGVWTPIYSGLMHTDTWEDNVYHSVNFRMQTHALGAVFRITMYAFDSPPISSITAWETIVPKGTDKGNAKLTVNGRVLPGYIAYHYGWTRSSPTISNLSYIYSHLRGFSPKFVSVIGAAAVLPLFLVLSILLFLTITRD